MGRGSSLVLNPYKNRQTEDLYTNFRNILSPGFVDSLHR